MGDPVRILLYEPLEARWTKWKQATPLDPSMASLTLCLQRATIEDPGLARPADENETILGKVY